ncbi:hypothetical protein A6R68_18149 [Neotoma lepida]|uniref:SWIM-type zinc finger 7 associated protein 1 n=1 Tax=Neotoma lepida TaxID=56216 RepID=A0A1A6HLQ7_NEOLE|nr:hypothetical protein A6R68_18149 [Neotoma lepida]
MAEALRRVLSAGRAARPGEDGTAGPPLLLLGSPLPELLQLLASAHEAPGPVPSLLLLDGLEEYLAEDSGAQEAAYLAALLLDTAAYFSHRLGASGSCGLVVALETQKERDGDAPHLTLLQRYFPAQCWLQPDALGLGQQHCVQASLERGKLSPRMEWSVTFLPNGEMKITPQPTQASKPGPD